MSKEIFTVRMEKSILRYIKSIIKKEDGRDLEKISNYEAAQYSMKHFVMCSSIALNVATASNGKEYYTTNEAAARLGIPPRTIRDWCKKSIEDPENSILPCKRFGRLYKIDRDYVDRKSEVPNIRKED